MTTREKLRSVTLSARKAQPGSEARKSLYAYANRLLLQLVNENLQ